MHANQMHRAVSALSSPQAMALITAIKDSRWYIPSRAAAKAKVHTSTATKHLAALHEAGVLERRRVRTETGRAYAYRLPRPSITLTLDLFPQTGVLAGDQVDAAFSLFAEVVRKAESLGGPSVRDRVTQALRAAFPRELEGVPNPSLGSYVDHLRRGTTSPESLAAILRAVRGTVDACVGPLACDRIFRACLGDPGGERLLSRLPSNLLLGPEVAQ